MLEMATEEGNDPASFTNGRSLESRKGTLHFIEALPDLFFAHPHRFQQQLVVAGRCLQVRMWVTGLAGKGEEDHQSTPHERLGLGQPVRGHEQRGQIAEVSGHVEVSAA